jgi:nitrate reductase NapE component
MKGVIAVWVVAVLIVVAFGVIVWSKDDASTPGGPA